MTVDYIQLDQDHPISDAERQVALYKCQNDSLMTFRDVVAMIGLPSRVVQDALKKEHVHPTHVIESIPLYSWIEVKEQLSLFARASMQEERGSQTLGAYVNGYFRRLKTQGSGGKGADEQTLARQTTEVNHILRSTLARVPVRHIDFTLVESTREEWKHDTKANGERYSPATLNSRVKVYNALISYAYEYERIERKPPAMVRYYEDKKKTGKAFSRGDAQKITVLFRECEAYRKYYPFVLISFLTGARFCEVSALHWDDIDFKGRSFRFSHSQVDGIRTVGRKGGVESPVYPLTDHLYVTLVAHLEQMKKDYPIATRLGIITPSEGDPLLRKHHGYLQRNYFAKVMERACKLAGIEVYCPHDIRRTVNTELQRIGTNPEITRELLGHATHAMTSHYTHFTSEDRKGLINSLSAAFVLEESSDE